MEVLSSGHVMLVPTAPINAFKGTDTFGGNLNEKLKVI